MGRRKVQIQPQENEKEKRITLKKRRLGLIKKAMQLSILCGAKVSLSVYNNEDHSMVHYSSDGNFSKA